MAGVGACSGADRGSTAESSVPVRRVASRNPRLVRCRWRGGVLLPAGRRIELRPLVNGRRSGGGLVRLDRPLVGAVRDALQRAATVAQPDALVIDVVDLGVAHLPLAGEEGAPLAGQRLLADLEHL